MNADLQHASTFLFVPGDRPERFDKAASSGSDVVICDLEDAVATTSKETARASVASWLGTTGRAAVRINPAGTPWHEDDMAALRGLTGLIAVVVPKADDPKTLARVGELCGVPVIALVESALGVARVQELARTECVVRLAFGSIDYCVDIDAEETAQTLLLPRTELVLASRVAGLPGPVDGVTTDLRPNGSAGEDARQARRLGFTGKLLIHPGQIAPVAGAFQPSRDDVTWATRVLEAASGGGAIEVDGAMVDEPVLRRARRIIAANDRTTETESS